MCSHIFKKRSKPLARLLGTKQSCKNSYTIPEKTPDERLGKRVKIKKMHLYPKQKLSLNEYYRQKGGGQPQPIDEDGEGLQWSQLMGL
jgi:hypothetical protein